MEYVRWAFDLCERLKGQHRHARDQLLRASSANPLNIAEGNGKATAPDRRRYFQIARGSALECVAIQDVLQVSRAISAEENVKGKNMLDRMVAMLTKLGRRGWASQSQPFAPLRSYWAMIQKLNDSPIEEIHQVRREISDRFDGDMVAIAEDAARRQAASGRPIWQPGTANKTMQRSLPESSGS